MRRGQMEIMGIAVIVILITFGLLFYLRFATINNGEESVQKQFQKASMATYFIQSILDTSVRQDDCEIEGKFKDLISDCVANSGCRDDCTPGVDPGCVGSINCIFCKSRIDGVVSDTYDISSCKYLEQEVRGILTQTLVPQGKDFKFFIRKADSQDPPYVELRSPTCKSVRNFREIPLASGERVSMSMCD